MSPQEAAERARVCVIAREWIGTPYHDAGTIKGRNGGTDCAQILRLVYLEAGLIPPIDVPPYSPQFFLHQSAEIYMGRVAEHAREISEAEALPGDVVLYRFGKCYAHGAIIIEPGWPHIIHAYYQAKMVVRGMGLDGALGRPKHVRKYFTRW